MSTKFIVTHRKTDTFNPVCPVCGHEDPAAIDWATAQALVLAGASSICVDCDPSAAEQRAGWPLEAQHVEPVEVATGQLVPCSECGQLYHDTDRWRPGRGFCPDCALHEEAAGGRLCLK